MAEVTEATGYLSIGEVLGLLLEEFPDVTISKIRFLESQGLISPERTASGYRKFYEPDVELLRVILTEQRRNYLPLRVIKDRLDSGEIDPTGEHLRPHDDVTPSAGLHAAHPESTDGHRPDHTNETHTHETHAHDTRAHDTRADETADLDHTPAEVPRAAIRSHPASRGVPERVEPTATTPTAATSTSAPERPPATAQLLPGVLLDRSELCAMTGMHDDELRQLEEFGIVTAKPGSYPALYGDDAVEIAKPACEFLRMGVDARHLRMWRTAAEREASLYEQLVIPRYRQRNPESRAEALAQLRTLDALGASLRAALTRQALRHHFDA